MKTPHNEISLQKTLRAFISDSRVVNGGIFSSNYTSYTITTKPLDYKVERRYNDFYWLRCILDREYPGLYVEVYNYRYLLFQKKMKAEASRRSSWKSG